MKLLRLFSKKEKKNLDDHFTNAQIKLSDARKDLKIEAVKALGLDKTNLGEYLIKEAELKKESNRKLLKSLSRSRQATFLKSKRDPGETLWDIQMRYQDELLHNKGQFHDESYKNLVSTLKNDKKK